MSVITNLILLLQPQSKKHESYLDNTPAHRLERIYDIRMVRSSETSRNEDFYKLAPDSRHIALMGCRVS
jgi:hypothetical protein